MSYSLARSPLRLPGSADCIMLLTSCYIILIVDNIDSDPCQIILIHVACAVAVSEESEGRKGTGPSGPSRARDTRGTR